MWELILTCLHEISNQVLDSNHIALILHVYSNLSKPRLRACSTEASKLKLRTQHPSPRHWFSKMFCQRQELHDSFWISKHEWHAVCGDRTHDNVVKSRVLYQIVTHAPIFWILNAIIWPVALIILMKIKA